MHYLTTAQLKELVVALIPPILRKHFIYIYIMLTTAFCSIIEKTNNELTVNERRVNVSGQTKQEFHRHEQQIR